MQLVKDPAMIFLDEPTSGLDSEMACQVMDSLISLARRDRLVRSPRRSIVLSKCSYRSSSGSHVNPSAGMSLFSSLASTSRLR